MVKYVIPLLLAGPLLGLFTLALMICSVVIMPAIFLTFIMLIAGDEDKAEHIFCMLGEWVFDHSPIAWLIDGITYYHER
jgi:hypothetical protein